jgi:DNA-binding transcriptional MerR regulator
MRISKVSEQTDVSADTLRYYERVGLLPPVLRKDNGIRDFQEIDIRRIEFIKCMRKAGIPIETLTEYIQLVQEGDDTISERKNILIKQREKLLRKMAEMQETLDLLNYKINVYEDAVLKREKEIAIIDV